MKNNLWKAMNHLYQNKHKYCIAKDGDNFEQTMKAIFKKYGLTEIVGSKPKEKIEWFADYCDLDKNTIKSFWIKTKNEILLKNSIEIVANNFPGVIDFFIHQPFGSQNFPDFLIFTSENVIPIEIKYSKNPKTNTESVRPMWNSNLPKANSIYIFGIATKDVTFFKGSDMLNHDVRIKLNNYFDSIGDEEELDKIQDTIETYGNSFGFWPYVRKAFNHNKKHSTSYNDANKIIIESYFSKKRDERENKVFKFLELLDKSS